MSKKPFDLRLANPADAQSIAALSIQVFLDTYATEGVRPDLAAEAFSEYSTEQFTQRLNESTRQFILAQHNTALLGYAEIQTHAAMAPGSQVYGAELIRLYIQPVMQRQGVGRALIDRAEQIARQSGALALWLTAWAGNTNAQQFYQRVGYSVVGHTEYAFGRQAYANSVYAKTF